MSDFSIPVATLGVPRTGRYRELKFTLESYWSGQSSAVNLLETAKALRAASWTEQRDRHVTKIPSNDFSLYDHMLDTVVTGGAIPQRYGWKNGPVPLETYFAMARGSQNGNDARRAHGGPGHGAPALEMTKWFDTNYHYMVPELKIMLATYFGDLGDNLDTALSLPIAGLHVDLERTGARMIQIDEAALRGSLPLREGDWQAYLDWAVECFRLAASDVGDATQIHTHMCYSEFNDVIETIAAMDADVVSIETPRSRMELLDAFRSYKYSNEIRPGVYDIHSPRVPEVGEMTELLGLARQRLSDDQIWINPDCGLKTRKWGEVRPALVNMVAAARQLRATIAGGR